MKNIIKRMEEQVSNLSVDEMETLYKKLNNKRDRGSRTLRGLIMDKVEELCNDFEKFEKWLDTEDFSILA